jgi:hypothetical protein
MTKLQHILKGKKPKLQVGETEKVLEPDSETEGILELSD